MSQIIKQFAAIWKKLGINQKVTIILLLVAFFIGMAAVVRLSGRPSYEMLYSDMNEKDMAAAVEFLKESKIPYQVTDGGRTLMVAEGHKYDIRLGLADKGALTGGHVGLELWNANGFGASPMAEQMMKRRAMQGELARTIMHLQQVEWADVQIAQAEESLFASEQQETTAAITLKMHEGRSLNATQVAGICRLVAGSVEGLKSDNVTIIDENGNLLTQSRSDSATAAAADAQNYRRAYEEYLVGKAQGLLDRALGPGKSVVKVSAVLDMNLVSETREDFDANNRVARNEKMQSKNSSTLEAGSSAGGSQSEEINEVSYEIPRSVTTTQSAVGAVKRLDVALIIDPTTVDAEGNAATLTQEQIDGLSKLVKRAVGFQEGGERTDTMEVTALPFAKTATPAAENATTGDSRQYMLQMVRYASAGLAAVLFVGFAFFWLRKTNKSAAPVAASGNGASLPPDLLAFGNGNGNGNGGVQLRNRVKNLIAQDPATAARLLQKWITEDGDKKGKS